MSLAISIVLFDNGDELEGAIESVLAVNADLQLYLIDNSPTDLLKRYANDKRITYIFNGKNHGYGRAHNIALRNSLSQKIKYHLVMNPDICFGSGTIEAIIQYMDANLGVGALIPRIYYESGELQRLCKLLPAPFDLIGRRFFPKTQWASRRNKKYELNDFDYQTSLNTPCLSGCFMFLRVEVLECAGIFDERFFMYLEDYDLSRRIHRYSSTVLFPDVFIMHGFKKESYKNTKLLLYHLSSAIKYFNKWGWLHDWERKKLNDDVLKQISETY